MAAVRTALWTLPFLWIKRVVEGCRPARFVQGRLTELEVAWAVRLASRYVPRATCLTQALTAQMLLSWAGIEGTLHIGVRMDPDFAAHAWVECGGRILVGGTVESARYEPMLTVGGPPAP